MIDGRELDFDSNKAGDEEDSNQADREGDLLLVPEVLAGGGVVLAFTVQSHLDQQQLHLKKSSSSNNNRLSTKIYLELCGIFYYYVRTIYNDQNLIVFLLTVTRLTPAS